MILASKHISISIQRSAEEVYTFASDPQNLPQWAAGLSGSIQNVNGEWIASSPMGEVKVKFVDHNPFGVLDHYVTLPSGMVIYNPLRVFPNADGTEVVFTLYRQPEMSDQQFADDARMVEEDLRTLKTLLENNTK
jgi:hypothetical protein